MHSKTFPCYKCGECCRHLNENCLYRDLDRGDGICKFLEGNLCSIYSERPLICRIDSAYDVFFSKFITKEEYYEKNISACNSLNRKARVSDNKIDSIDT